MANKTQSGQLFSARSMNGIIELNDGAGTIISGGIIQTNDINTGNLTSDFITANNLLEGDVDETISGKWTFSQTPYITQAPTNANDATNKAYIDDNFVGLLGTQNIIGTKTFENAFMSASYTPISAKQITTKEYVDAIGTPTIESVLQQGNDANGETMTGLSNLTMDTGYTPTLDLEVSTKNYSDVFTGKIDATNNSFFTSVEFFNAPFQRTGTTTIPVGTYTIQSLLTQIATSLQQTFIADVPPSVVLTEWIFDPATNKVSARLPNNTIIPELSHRLDPLLQLLGFQGARPLQASLLLTRNSPATLADHPQHLPYLKQYADDTFVDLTNIQSVGGAKTFTDIPYFTAIRDNALVNGTKQLYINTTTGEIGSVLSVSPIIDLEYVLQQGNDANGETMTGLSNLTMDTGYSPTTSLQVATKEYADNNFVDLTSFQTITGGKTFTGRQAFTQTTDMADILMFAGYTPTTAYQVATKDYVDSVVAGGGITENLLFDTQGNSRFQELTGTTPPTPLGYGYNNTMIGKESAYQLPNDILTMRNTFLGYRAGWYYALGYAGASDCTFLGAWAGWNGNNVGYAWNRTTCLGYRSYANKSDQVAIGHGGVCEVRLRGALVVDGISYFNPVVNFANGLNVNGLSTFNGQADFNQDIYRIIGGVSYRLLSQYDAYTKTETDALIDAKDTFNNGINVSGVSTFSSQVNFNQDIYRKIGSISYRILSQYDAYTKTETNNLLAAKADTTYVNTQLALKADQTDLIARTPLYYSQWYYGSQNTSFTGLSSWNNGAVAFSHYSPLTSNLGNSTYTSGEGVPAGTEDINQMSQYGTWTANVAGMYHIECAMAMYPSYQMELYMEVYAGGSWSAINFFRLRHQVSVSGSNPYGIPFNMSKMIYLNANEAIRIRGNASGSITYGYIYTYYKSSYLQITRMTGYT
jgi:hypothetical protein